jgi:two-component system NarL family sensor kinase
VKGNLEAPAWSDLLHRIIGLSSEERNLRALLRGVAELVVATMQADACFVHVVDHKSRQLVLMGATPEQFDALAGTIRLQMGEGLAGWVAQHGKPVFVKDKWNDPRYLYIPALRGEDFDSLISVPMRRPHEVIVGVLNVHFRDPRALEERHVENLSAVASLLAGIVENALLFDRQAAREAEVEQFASRTIELQESDRRRIAIDIHDGISQRLISAWYHVRAARGIGISGEVDAELEMIDGLLSDALEEAHHVIVGLRPSVLDDLGLTAGITSVSNTLGGGVEVELDLDDTVLPSHLETGLYRIVQEALQNVVKHSGAQRVAISLRSRESGVLLSISDDGKGFDRSQPAGLTSYGLKGMQERAKLLGAHLDITSLPGKGTKVTVSLPRPGEDESITHQ